MKVHKQIQKWEWNMDQLCDVGLRLRPNVPSTLSVNSVMATGVRPFQCILHPSLGQ